METDDISNIIKEKYKPIKTILAGIGAKVLDRYAKYNDLEWSGRITPIAFSLVEKGALLSLYSSKTKTAKSITDGVLGMVNPNHSDTCLYCGIGEIDQIDHYLPQEHFPEYSILHKNLIPICGTCNEIKSSHIPGFNGKNYLHLIYDILPQEGIFKCEIMFIQNLPLISFSLRGKFAGTIIESHFSELSLKKRIEKKAVQYFLQIKALKEQFGIEYAKEELERDLNRISVFFGLYYWKTELILAMINSNFVDNVS